MKRPEPPRRRRIRKGAFLCPFIGKAADFYYVGDPMPLTPCERAWRWLRSLFAWSIHHEAGVWAYYENSVTGLRIAMRRNSGGYSPIDQAWLDYER